MSTTATFTHTPRPAIVPANPEYGDQRRYGSGDCALSYKLYQLEVIRYGDSDLAEVIVKIGYHTGATIRAELNADELRDLAARLIDAAHDIETFPAPVLARAEQGGAA
jgi:hypothetical protein